MEKRLCVKARSLELGSVEGTNNNMKKYIIGYETADGRNVNLGTFDKKEDAKDFQVSLKGLQKKWSYMEEVEVILKTIGQI